MTNGEYLSSNTGISYPFKNGQEIPDHIVRLFVDASIYSDSFDQSLTSAEYSLGAGVLKFTVGRRMYSTPVTAKGTFLVVKNGCSSFVLDREYLDTLSDFEFTGDIKFEETCFVVPSKTVNSIEIYNGDDDPRNAILSGDVCISGGYNVDLDGQDDGILKISAEPGAGTGTVPCDTSECEEDPDTSGERLPAENGNTVITADDCYEVTASGSTIKIHGKCTACCQCQDYIDVVNILKDVAARVKDTKDDLTGPKTNTYFDFIHKQSLKNGYPDLDIQLDIAPDGDISSIAARGLLNEERDFYSFRVTATITNLSGVPCLIMTPTEQWSGSDISSTFPGWLGSGNMQLIGGSSAPLQYCMHRGLVPLLCYAGGYSASSSYSIRSDIGRDDPRGWMSQFRARGPVIRQLSASKSGVKYTQPDTGVYPASYVSGIKSGLDNVISKCAEWAITDLNAGINPSGMLNEADTMTDALIRLSGSSTADRGFLAHAGYSFTLSWVYALPGYILGDIKSIVATYCCIAYAPLIAYNFAYNFAESETEIRTTKDGTVHYNTWKAGKYTVDSTRLIRPHIRWTAYDIGSGKQLYRGNEDSKWK